MSLSAIVQRGWDAIGTGDFDTLVEDYVEGMTFIMPGQADVLEGRSAFRGALDGLGGILPPGFEITGLRQIEGENEVVSIVEWDVTGGQNPGHSYYKIALGDLHTGVRNLTKNSHLRAVQSTITLL